MNEIKVGDKIFIEVKIKEKCETDEGIYFKANFIQCKLGGSHEKIIDIYINKWNNIQKSPVSPQVKQ